jgi:hypothetical protein
MIPNQYEKLGPSSPSICIANPAFETKKAAQSYLASISPPRDLVCPITQELYENPMLASDGHTYEKYAIQTWFDSQRSSTGSIRSPVTNAYIDMDGPGMLLIENKAVTGMARNYREQLGRELCMRCQVVWDDAPDCLGDDGFRIKGLVEAGADLSLKECRKGNTAFMALMQSQNTSQIEVKITLLKYFLSHSTPVTLANEEGKNVAELTKEILSKTNISEFSDLLEQISNKAKLEEEKRKAHTDARNELNTEHRERQRVLADNARNHGSQHSDFENIHGLGRLEDGWGYFPSLVFLLFQGNVPAPPPSFAEEETKEKKRLQFILRSTSVVVLVFLFVC